MDAAVCAGCRERDARIAALEAEVAALKVQVHDLTRKPAPPRPPQELPAAPAKTPSGKPRGAQRGHPPRLKQLLPADRVSAVVPFVPTACRHCQAPLPVQAGPDDPAPTRHPVAELPDLTARITEYQGHTRTCPDCGKQTYGPIPAAHLAHSIDPNLTAAMSYLAGCHGVSKRGVEEIVETLCGVPVALGTVANLEQEMSAALAAPHQEALAAVQEAAVKHLDETGWKEGGKKRWLWVAATANVVVFLIHHLRNAAVLPLLLGQHRKGFLCSDRWRAYDWASVWQRQVCWAHLKRNFAKLQERGGKAWNIGQACLAVTARVFELWHLFRGGGCTRAELDRRMYAPMIELLHTLQRGSRSRDGRTARFCERLLEVFPALWTFVMHEGTEPTNNHAEQVQRRAVLWRRKAFGCASAAGCRFVERILTVVQTLRLQQRSAYAFLKEAIAAHRTGQKAPPLVVEG